jgi:type II secretory pathway pseudopilin PulG
MDRHRHIAAFTLVELLVVVTIIVVLLAMLMPALGAATYQAMLVRCAANQRLTANAAIQYAFNARGFYPPRPRTTNGGLQAWAIHLPATADTPAFDMKPVMRQQLGLDPNKVFQCPLIEPIDLDERLPDEFVYGNTALWFSWRYTDGTTPQPGMYKLGDRFEWRGRAYNIMVSDIDLVRPSPTGNQTAHPDFHSKTMFNAVFVRVNVLGNVALPHTFDDASVRQVMDLKIRDERLDDLPVAHNNSSPQDVVQVPRQQ